MRIDLKLDKDGRAELASALQAALAPGNGAGVIALVRIARARWVGAGPQLRIAGELVGKLGFWFASGHGRLADTADVVDGAPSDRITLHASVIPNTIYWELHPKEAL